MHAARYIHSGWATPLNCQPWGLQWDSSSRRLRVRKPSSFVLLSLPGRFVSGRALPAQSREELGFGIPGGAAAQQPVCRSSAFPTYPEKKHSDVGKWDTKKTQIVCWKIRTLQHLGESKWTVLLKIQQYAKILPKHCSDAVVSCHVFWPL